MFRSSVTPKSDLKLRRFLTVGAFGLGSILALGACGGGGEPDLGGILEAAAEAGGADIDDLNFDPETGGVSAGFGDADIAMGTDIGRPEWLESEFQLPDGLEVNMAINDASTGERTIRGELSGTTAADVMNQQQAMLAAAGYERVGDSSYFIREGRPAIDVTVGDQGGRVNYSFQFSNETHQTLRDAYAPIEGQGTMVATVGSATTTYEGPCTLRSTDGSFTSDDNLGSLTVEPREGQQDYILGSVSEVTADAVMSLGILQVDDQGNYPTVELRSDGFSFDGFMVDFGTGEQVTAVLVVTCPG